jgi:hypothetical protein
MANHGDVFAHVEKFEVYDEVRCGLHTVTHDLLSNQYFCIPCNRQNCFHALKVMQTVENKRMDAAPLFNRSVLLINRG